MMKLSMIKIDEDDTSDKADNDEPNINHKAETDDSDIDVEEEEEGAEEEEEEGKEEDSDDPLRLLIEEAFERCQSEFDERVAKHMARQGVDEDDARKPYRKALANIFVNEMLWFHAMRKDSVFLSVKNTVSDLKLLDDYDNEEA